MNPERGSMGRITLQLRGATHVTGHTSGLSNGRIEVTGLRLIAGRWKVER